MLKNCRVHPTLPATDLSRARRFYEETLGIPPATELPSGVFYTCGSGTRFAVSDSAGAASGGHTQMAFAVDDIGKEVQTLRDRGVRFEEFDLPGLKTVDGIVDRGFLKAAWFRDTEGNLIALMEAGEPPAEAPE